MKISLLGDLHFGVKKNNLEFLNSQLRFFNECFFPYLEKNNIENIMCLGDTFENRQNLNINILNYVDNLMVNQFNKYNTYMLVGNHDSYFNTAINVHSLKTFRHLKNISIIDDIEKINIDGTDILLIPWQVDNQAFIKRVMDKNFYCPIAMGHLEIDGFNLNNAKVCDFGISPDIFFQNYGITFSGHFHKRKCIERNGKKIQYIGNTYELTRSDLNEPKGFCILDTDTLEFEFINNDVSIKHKRFVYPDEYKKEDIDGNIIDVIVDISNDYNEKDFQNYMLNIDSYNPYSVDLKLLNEIDVKSKGNYKVQTTEELIEEYINNTELEDNIKKDINEKINMLCKQCKQEI